MSILKLATDLDRFAYEFDPYDYADNQDSYNVQDIALDIYNGEVDKYITSLLDIDDDDLIDIDMLDFRNSLVDTLKNYLPYDGYTELPKSFIYGAFGYLFGMLTILYFMI